MSYLTIAETSDFTKIWRNYLTQEEYDRFKVYLAQNPEAGDVIQGSNGLRKIRWSTASKGKSGGVRVIYINKRSDGTVWLVTIYTKSKDATLKTSTLNKLNKGEAK